jgi:hypothetical protein
MFGSALYDNFTYSIPSVVGGITPEQIIVTPIVTPLTTEQYFPGLNFSAKWSVAAGRSERSAIGYRVVPFPPATASTPSSNALLVLDLGQSQVSGIIGSVTVQETVNAGALSARLKVYDKCVEVCSIKQMDTVTLASITTLQVNVLVSLSGGTNGASLNSFATDVNLCPECVQPQ